MAITRRQAAELAKQTFEYAPALEATDHIRIQPRYGLFVGGRMLEPHSRKLRAARATSSASHG